MGALGAFVAVPVILESCEKVDPITGSGDCEVSPSETKGPFPIKTPADLVRENIISDRSGIPLLIELTVVDSQNDCQALSGALVDIWHCDADGNYSEYGGTQMQTTNYTSQHFLRGRQTSDSNGKVAYLSIFPGWYPGRAPHIHLEVLSGQGNSLLVSQIAFPTDICNAVYDTTHYHGTADTSNSRDNIFSDSLDGNMLDEITGNTTDGYTLKKTIVV